MQDSPFCPSQYIKIVDNVVASEKGDIMKLKRGHKLCKKCGNVNGARAKICKHCNKEFEVRTDPVVKMKRARSKAARKGLVPVENWRELKAGQYIHFKGRSGNYFIKSDGTKDFDTPKGVYKIYEVLDEGLGVWGNRGYTFLYMGKEKRSIWGGEAYLSAHKIYIKSAQKS